MDLSSLTNVDPETLALGSAAVSGVASFVCAFLPAPKVDSGLLYRAVYGLLNWLGCNKGKAQNADDVFRLRK